MIDEATITLICKSLDDMKAEINKRNVIAQYGVDLANYENTYFTVSLNLLTHLLGGGEEEINWWLFESVDKVYFHTDGRPDANVENSSDFIDYLINYLSDDDQK